MSDVIIRVENLGKKYTIGHQTESRRYIALRDVLAHNAKNLWHKTKDLVSGKPIIQGDTMEEVWALKNVNFEIRRGEAVGIIGRNGAGKSTLLKILSRITEPSTGRVTIKGRVASLLEVGTGFHPELTGRENIYLNGTILGMTRVEIKQNFDEIVAFAEVEKYLDTPVKRYSSGMYVRLAFAVAAHLEPEILLVDEVLAVGDAQFQKKCLGKMEDVSHAGRTVLFVSHNMAAIEQLTKNTLFLKKGSAHFFGKTKDAIQQYIKQTNVQMLSIYDIANKPRMIQGNQLARLLSLQFTKDLPIFDVEECLCFKAHVKANDKIDEIRFSMTIHSLSGISIGSCFGQSFHSMKRGHECVFEVSLRDLRLAPGNYCLAIAIGKGDNTTGYINYDVIHDVLHFEIRPKPGVDATISVWGNSWGYIQFPQPHQKVVDL